MNLFKQKKSVKQTVSKKEIKERKQRVLLQTHPSTQDAIFYTSQFQEGLMHIVEDEYSQMYRLGEVNYEVSTDLEQENVIVGYSEALNKIDKNSRYQLLVINRSMPQDLLAQTLLPYQADEYDDYRGEINDIIKKQYDQDERNFEVEKYAIFSTKSHSRKQAKKSLSDLSTNYKNQFSSNSVSLSVEQLDGLERLKVMSSLLRPHEYFSTSYEDIALSGLTSKAFISPVSYLFPKNRSYFKLGKRYAATLYIRSYPKYLEDTLIKELCQQGHELAISIHATPYDMNVAKKKIKSVGVVNKREIAKQQKRNGQNNYSDDMISGTNLEVQETVDALTKEFKDNGQRYFSGIFSVMVTGETELELKDAIKSVKDVGESNDVNFEVVDMHKEEALNTILPIGKPYLDVEMNYSRDMTTFNVTTQIPFTNVELQHPSGQFYGRNQLTNNMITIDRKGGLIAPGGLIFGSSGSGKGMTTKWEIISSRLKYPNDKFIIVDPESEYLEIAREFGAEILDISTGTSHHFNILDIPEKEFLEEDDNVDLVKEKANLLNSLFESQLKDFTDEESSLVDRAIRKTYQNFENSGISPTLVDWHKVLKEEPEEIAQTLAVKVEKFVTGSQNIFAHQTNIDLTADFLVFNIKKLDDGMKPFAMKVILDQIWKQVVNNQHKVTTRLYFDEIQLNFDTEANAKWFSDLWSRIRKYGAIPTGITQNVSTLLSTLAGSKMISNSEFIVLLRQKPVDVKYLNELMSIPPKLMEYIGESVKQGTGIISANGMKVPFENPIPKQTKLYEIMNTDA